MTDLPEGWEWTTLGEIADSTLGKMLDRAKDKGDPRVPYLRNVNVQWGSIDLGDVLEMEMSPSEIDFFSLRYGDLLVCEGGEVGRSAVWKQPGRTVSFQKALHRVRPHGDVDSRYILYFLMFESQVGNLLRYTTGSTIKHLPQQQLKKIALPLPPLAEQRRIVATLEDHLSRVDAGIAGVGSAARKLDSFRDRVLAAAADGSLLDRSAESALPPAPAGVVDGDLPDIPSGWEWKRLGEIAEVVGGITKDSKKQSDLTFPEVPYLRVANVQRGALKLDDVASIRADPKKIEKLSLRAGDVLLNEGGDRDKLGRGWIWEGQISDCIHQNHVFRARVHEGVLHPKLLSWHANGFGKDWFFSNGKQSVNLASVSLSTMKLLPVPVPPREHQYELVNVAESYLTMFDEAERLIAQAQTRAERLRRSLLREAFAGRLVEQDPDDEPASVLLERIRTERADAPKAKRPRKPRAAKIPEAESKEIASDRPLPTSAGKGTQDALELDL